MSVRTAAFFRRAAAWILTVACAAGCATPPRTPLQLLPASELRFASRDDGARLLAARDEFVGCLSEFDRAARTGLQPPVSDDAYLAFTAAQALDWTPEEVQTLRVLMERVSGRIRGWRLPLPPTVTLVKTTGKEEGGALYTRGAAIFLPEEFVRGLGSESRENVLIHELFHVLSRNAPDLQRRLYQIVGFQIGGDLDLPPALARRKITNPDAPRVNCYLPIEKEGRTLQLAPLLLAKSAEYDTARGGGVFAYLTLRLVEASPEGGRWICAPEGGEPRLHEIDSVPEYQEKIGRNTDYIIHPEEVLADNFVLLATGVDPQKLPTPRILEEMRAVLERLP